MSDATNRAGEPVDEPRDVDGVVGSANESLAEADAAARDAVGEPVTEAAPEPVVVEEPVVETDAAPEAPAPEPVAASDDVPTYPVYDEPAATEAPTTAYEQYAPSTDAPVITPSEPIADAGVAGVAGATAVAPQPIFVQAPEPPRPRGNRAAAGAIGLLAAIAFALLYLGAWLGFGAITGDVTIDNVGTTALEAVQTWAFWVPVVVFFLGFWLLGAIINRGRWGAWVIFGLLVGFVGYGGHILGQLFQAPFWMLTAREGLELVEGQLLSPLAIAAFIIARELTIWFSAWVAARGRRVTELNQAAQYEYERTLEAGPTLVRP